MWGFGRNDRLKVRVILVADYRNHLEAFCMGQDSCGIHSLQ